MLRFRLSLEVRHKMNQVTDNNSGNKNISADPSWWSEKSQRSYAAQYTKTYKDQEYNCWRCQKKSVFTAEDQKYTYEVRKAYYWQQRILCQACWKEKNLITHQNQECEKLWAESKQTLRQNQEFLQKWLSLLVVREEYVPYRPNIAIKKMINKLLEKNAQ